VVADSVKKKLPVFVCLCLVFGYNYETILCHEKGIEGLIMIFFKSLVLLVYLYILVLWIVSRNFFLFLFFLLTYILLLRLLNNFVSLKGIKGFFYGSSLLGVVRNIESFGILLIRGSEFYWDCVFCRCFITAESMNFFEQTS
jgi:hypothetical protein